LPAVLASAADIFDEAEKDARNRHYVLWYQGSNEAVPAGGILWDQRWEIQASRRLVEGKGLLTHVPHLPIVPQRADVAKLIALMAPNLLVALPQDFQQSHFRTRG
jgi:hypothetical protein